MTVAGLTSLPGQAHCSAAERGVVALGNSAALELAPCRIRVDTAHPWGVATPMGEMGAEGAQVSGDSPSCAASMGQAWSTPPISRPEDVAAAVLFLASGASRTITGIQLPVDHGATEV